MRLIDADAFEVVTYKGTETFSDCFDNGVLYMLNELDKAPIVDAEPVKHGHWVKEPTDTFGFDEADYHCSECRRRPVKDVLTNYCPNCGAKMDEVNE